MLSIVGKILGSDKVLAKGMDLIDGWPWDTSLFGKGSSTA